MGAWINNIDQVSLSVFLDSPHVSLKHGIVSPVWRKLICQAFLDEKKGSAGLVSNCTGLEHRGANEHQDQFVELLDFAGLSNSSRERKP